MSGPSLQNSGRERLSLDRGWRFHLGDIPFPIIRGHPDSYSSAKAGRAFGAAAPEHDDTYWRELDLPHDWAVESPFDPLENLSQGYRRRGFGWYRRHFPLPTADRGRHLELQFDGVATHCTVWVNGTAAHRNWCGYTSFSIDITPFARFGDELNHIAIRVDANTLEGWWYEGAGIYRHTWLMKRDRAHIATDGLYANPIREKDGSWIVPAEVVLANSGERAEQLSVTLELRDPAGKSIATARTDTWVEPLTSSLASARLSVMQPQLWSSDDPKLYSLEAVVTRREHEVDRVSTTCGFRTLRFDADHGFFLNEKSLKLKGVCCHQDHAGVGVAVPDALWDFRVRKLKEMGVNAYRCAHNPPSAEFLDICDRHGILVMDENRHFNTTPEYTRQLEWLVRRDRNHPCVFMWSVCNEEPMQGTEVGYEMVRRMTTIVKRLDPTRPVTAAMNGGLFNPINVAQGVDVVGFNYQVEFYDRFHAANPQLPITSSEDTSAFMTRGEFFTDRTHHLLGSLDTERAPWGATHRDAWKAIAERPYLAGGFVWTGFDYRGEPTPLQWPSVSSFFGCMDLCGFPKTAFYLRQAQWIENRPILQLVPHWNWPGREGQLIPVLVCTNLESVSLFLNGELVSEKTVDRYEMASWLVPYAPGRLEAIGKKNGDEIARAIVETTTAPLALQLIPDRTSLAGDGRDALPITVSAIDVGGRAVPTANPSVEFELTGPGVILGHGNGDPNSHEPETGGQRRLFNGLAQVLVQTAPNATGTLKLRALAEGLVPAEISIRIEVVPAPLCVPVGQPVLQLQRWRISPGSIVAPDPNQEVSESDMNTWAGILPGDLQSFADVRWAIYRIRFTPYVAAQKAGGRLVFKSITGRAEIWLNKTLVGRKEMFESALFTVEIGLGEGERTLSVLVEAPPGQPAGLGAPVFVV